MTYDEIKFFLNLAPKHPVELRVGHIAKIWYEKVLREDIPNQIQVIDELFPGLIIQVRMGNSYKIPPKIDYRDLYIEGYEYDHKIYQGSTCKAVQVVGDMYGTRRRPGERATTKRILERAAKEICTDPSIILKLREHYRCLFERLSDEKLERFKKRFKEYVEAVFKDINSPKRADLFPFEPIGRLVDFNNDYLVPLFSFEKYPDYFLWMNLAALLRNEFWELLMTYDCSFDLKLRDRRTQNGLADESTWKKAIPKCLTLVLPRKPETGLIGRDEIVDQACTLLESRDCIVLLNGLGGIGKTAVMKEVCDRIFTDGRTDTYVAWITCGESLRDDLLILRDPLGVPADLGRDDAADAVIRKLQGLDGTLYLFLDNMRQKLGNEEMGILNALREHVRVMITSRSAMEGIPSIPLEALEKEPSVDVFYAYYKKDDNWRFVDDVWAVIHSDSVRCHTLLIELLAKAAQRTYGTIGDFREKLEEKGFFDIGGSRKFNTGRFDNLTIEESVIKLYDITDLSAEQQRIMRLFSIFSPEKVIYGAVEEWAELDVNEVDDLVERGWLVRTEDGLVIHQIIRDSMVRQMKRQGEGLRIEDYGNLLNRVADTDSYIPWDLEYTKVRERLTLAEDTARYLETRIKGIQDEPGEDKDILTDGALLFNNIATVYRAQGDYGSAQEYYGKAITVSERVLGPGHPLTATMYNNMGVVYFAQGDYGSAQEYYWKALSIREQTIGPGHPDTAETYNNMANVFQLQGEYEKALEYYGKALAVYESMSPEHPYMATMYSNMAGVYSEQGEYGRALEYCGKALAIDERVLGPGHPETATTYNNMAGMYYHQADYGKALEYYDKALAIDEHVLGPGHPKTATTYNNIGLVYFAQGDYGSALEYYGKALAIRESVLGPRHLETATTYNNMALVYSAQGDYGSALQYYRKALTVTERVLPPKHPLSATIYDNMAGVYSMQGDYESALEYYGKALSIREQTIGPGHPDTIETYISMSLVYHDQGDYIKALLYAGKALTIRK